jgi:hypothetical protein
VYTKHTIHAGQYIHGPNGLALHGVSWQRLGASLGFCLSGQKGSFGAFCRVRRLRFVISAFGAVHVFGPRRESSNAT